MTTDVFLYAPEPDPRDIRLRESVASGLSGSATGSTTSSGTVTGIAARSGTATGSTATSGTVTGNRGQAGSATGTTATSGTVTGTDGTIPPAPAPGTAGAFRPLKPPTPPRPQLHGRVTGTSRVTGRCTGHAGRYGTAGGSTTSTITTVHGTLELFDDDDELVLLGVI